MGVAPRAEVAVGETLFGVALARGAGGEALRLLVAFPAVAALREGVALPADAALREGVALRRGEAKAGRPRTTITDETLAAIHAQARTLRNHTISA
jgi:hypothetical protein